jgi:hypothetical protein
MGAVGAIRPTELTGETSLKHVNAIISAFFSVPVFRRQLMGLGTDTAVPIPEADQSVW